MPKRSLDDGSTDGRGKPDGKTGGKQPAARKAAGPGQRSKLSADELKAQKARRLAKQLGREPQLVPRGAPKNLSPREADRSVELKAQKMARQIARVLYTPISLDLVTGKDTGPAKQAGNKSIKSESRPRDGEARKQQGRKAEGRARAPGDDIVRAALKAKAPGETGTDRAAAADDKKNARDAAAADDPKRAAEAPRKPDKKADGDDLAALMNAEDFAALMSDDDMAELLDADDLAVSTAMDDAGETGYARDGAGTARSASATRTAFHPDELEPIDYRIPMGRTLLRIVLYGICLAALAGSYIFYKEIGSEDTAAAPLQARGIYKKDHGQRGFEPGGGTKNGEGQPRPPSEKPSSAEDRTESGPQTDEMKNVEGVRDARRKLGKPFFSR
jgi:hypothetical protein